MPCYLLDNVDRQRGKGVFDGSIRGLKRLNALGYGRDERARAQPRLQSAGAVAAAGAGRARGRLQARARRDLRHRVQRLFTLANMPIQRFGAILISKGQFDDYLRLAAPRASRRQPRRRDVPQPDLGRLSRLRVRLRLQPDARPAARARRARARASLRAHATTISPAIRSASPAIASAAPPARARAAAARLKRRRSEPRRPNEFRNALAARRFIRAAGQRRAACARPTTATIPSVLDRPAEIAADMLYVVGGLYGNLAALDAIERLAQRASARPSPSCSTATSTGSTRNPPGSPRSIAASASVAIRGNVETEIARATTSAPAAAAPIRNTSTTIPCRARTRSSTMLRAARAGDARSLAGCRCISSRAVGDLRVGIVHGDAAGARRLALRARCARRSGATPDGSTDVRRASGIDVFASTHTCLAALRDFDLPGGRLTVINNGAAGMPNFRGTTFGADLAHRDRALAPCAALRRSRATACSSTRSPSPTTRQPSATRFLARWPEGSPAHASYFRRIVEGPRLPDRIGAACAIIRPVPTALDHHAGARRGGRGSPPRWRRLRRIAGNGAEVIVVDGGSRDGTAELARPLADHVIDGAARARHADECRRRASRKAMCCCSCTPTRACRADADRLVRDGLARTGRAWGRFDIAIEGRSRLLADRWRSR